MDVAGAKVKVTASIGVASAEAFGYALEAVLHEADMAVYAAKRQGRNKVVVAMPPAAEPGPSNIWHRRETRDVAPAAIDDMR
jgi:hypothetical protein